MSGRSEEKVVIAGGGLAGCLVALALAERRPDVPFLLLEATNMFGGNHVWSFFDPDVAPEHRWLADPLIAQRWASYDILFPKRRRTIDTGYSSASSVLLDQHMRERLRPDQYRLGVPITAVTMEKVELQGGETIPARGVIDARGFPVLPERQREKLDLAWQKFVGRDYALSDSHGLDRPIVMDGTVEQADGYRFVYSLPFEDKRLLVEDTYYSTDSALDVAVLGDRLDDYLKSRGWKAAEIEREERGVLPVALGGDFERFWPVGEAGRIGVMGGFFHPTTGYSLPDAVRTAFLLARQKDHSGHALARLLRDDALRLWRERRFYRLLNRMLFRAAAPAERYRVLEHFYRLDVDLIGRFYAGQLSPWDKVRILSGKPPVPLSRALVAMWT
ncbi:MAG TPA: lycopene beta-cyclase CrtY [Allosphingosinicella sp.]|nr:lycopene beta-cyclase CrtY [Allosphingosinicella sp.]